MTDLDEAGSEVTEPHPAGAGPGVPHWSCRAWAGEEATDLDRAAVLELFTEPDFYFRTDQPDTRPEWEVLSLLDEDTRVLLADGRPAGLYALDPEGPAHGCHFQLHLRLRAAAPPAWWESVYREVLRAARWQHEIVRLTLRFREFDERGLRFARGLGLAAEGTLAGITVHEGRRRGQVFFSQIWTPTS
jgi:hypothetical protein